MESLAQIRALTISYTSAVGHAIGAVDSANLEIHVGEVVGLLGESGSGKSTLAGAMLQLLPEHAHYESGEIWFRGQDLRTLSESSLRQIRGRDIALIGQDPAMYLNPVMKAGDQISEVLRAHKQLSASERRALVEESLEEVALPLDAYSAYPHQLSGGQRQRVAIAQAMVCHPALVIADEATSKLDATLQTEIIKLMAEIRSRHGAAFLVITHDPAVLAGFADRIAVMHAGKVVEDDLAANIFRSPSHRYTQSLFRLAEQSLLGNRNGSTHSERVGVADVDPSRYDS
jgi:ABC-type glutathione transport system ATPase component